LICGGAVLVAAVWFRPIGFSGRGLAVLVLTVVNVAILLTRVAPPRLFVSRTGIAVMIVGAVSSAAMIAATASTASPIFAYFLTGQAGSKLERRAALTVATLASTLCTIVIATHLVDIHNGLPWYVGAVVGLTVLVGAANRNRQLALAAAQEAATQAQRAARSEAREHALAERARLARDVHDVLAHSLAGINMQLEVADALLDAGELGPAQQATHRAQSLVRAGLSEVQRTVRVLREDTLPLVETITAMVAASIPEADPPTVVGAVRDLDIEATQAVVRCAQEALTNAVKYAPGAPVAVTITFAEQTVELDVLNAAPPPAARPALTGSGMGLIGMRERMALVGGQVEAGPVPDGPGGTGWRVRVAVPSGAGPDQSA
jgi:signal transduction histidine kinase